MSTRPPIDPPEEHEYEEDEIAEVMAEEDCDEKTALQILDRRWAESYYYAYDYDEEW